MDKVLLAAFLLVCVTVPNSSCLNQLEDLKRHLNTDKFRELKSLFAELYKNSKAMSCLCDMVNGRGKEPENGTSLNRGAATYVRWGRTTCPGKGTKLMYSGYAAGDRYSGGSAADYLCLPKNPDWSKYDDKKNSNTAKIYGAEYEMHGHRNGEALNKNQAEYEVPCAVCQSTKRISVYMIPGKTRCFTGWHLEYRGYLMAGHPGHAPSEYACVDSHPETIGSRTNVNGKLFYPVEAVCGALKCPPYVNNREVTCAVCTR